MEIIAHYKMEEMFFGCTMERMRIRCPDQILRCESRTDRPIGHQHVGAYEAEGSRLDPPSFLLPSPNRFDHLLFLNIQTIPG